MVLVWPKGVCDACLSVFSKHFGKWLGSLLHYESVLCCTAFQSTSSQCIRPTAADIERIRDVPFLNTNDVIQSLKDQLPTYLVKVAEINDAFDILSDSMRWWKDISFDLASWSSAVQKVVLVQPSFAAAESLFITRDHVWRPAALCLGGLCRGCSYGSS